jgi:hypothetical protein
MKKTWLLLAIFLPTGAHAQFWQRIQNTDMFLGVGPAFAKTQVIPGTNVTLYNSTGFGTMFDAGYHVMRKTNVGLWVEFVEIWAFPAGETATIPGKVSLGGSMTVPGPRLMVPL